MGNPKYPKGESKPAKTEIEALGKSETHILVVKVSGVGIP